MNELPASGAGDIKKRYSHVWEAYRTLGEACADAGPLDAKGRRLVKLALAIGAGSEGAVHSHVRRALAEGIDAEALRQVAILAVPTLGLPAAAAGLSWINDLIED
ncbi:MAG: carboxymuconolactone decarboxylase family protein [Alphaproteobacteria bacterium]|nr:MAG: carboxymuconolactone decarboxylase family protein [Alphaproteobacteria bacterium]